MSAPNNQPSPGLAYYPRDQTAWSTLDILKASTRARSLDTTESFYRRARLIMHHSTMHMPILDILSRADELFTMVAERCGAQVVAHTFGLTDTEVKSLYWPGKSEVTHPSVPDNYELVAEVAIVPDATPITPEHPLYDPMKRTMLEIQKQAIKDNSWHWTDAMPEQYVITPAGVITQVDIEPFILKY